MSVNPVAATPDEPDEQSGEDVGAVPEHGSAVSKAAPDKSTMQWTAEAEKKWARQADKYATEARTRSEDAVFEAEAAARRDGLETVNARHVPEGGRHQREAPSLGTRLRGLFKVGGLGLLTLGLAFLTVGDDVPGREVLQAWALPIAIAGLCLVLIAEILKGWGRK